MNQNNIPALSSAGKNTGDSDDNYLYIKDPLWYIPQRITIILLLYQRIIYKYHRDLQCRLIYLQ